MVRVVAVVAVVIAAAAVTAASVLAVVVVLVAEYGGVLCAPTTTYSSARAMTRPSYLLKRVRYGAKSAAPRGDGIHNMEKRLSCAQSIAGHCRRDKLPPTTTRRGRRWPHAHNCIRIATTK